MYLKVAICISGQLRTFDQCFPSLKKNILEKFDCDIFLHTWRNRGISINSNINYINPNEIISDEILKSVYKPKKYKIEDFNNFKVYDKYKEISENINPVFPTFPMFYSQKICNDLKNEYSHDNNIKYDFVIRMRPDLQIINEIPDYVLENLNILWHQNLPDNVWWRTFDHFNISNNENMDVYCNAYEYMDQLWEETILECDSNKYDGRKLQTINMKINNITVKSFNDYIYKIQRHDLGI